MHTTHPDAVSVLFPHSATPTVAAPRVPGPIASKWVGSVQGLIAVCAMISGALMVIRPNGNAVGLGVSLLRAPFENFRVPGLLLSAGLGGIFLLGSWLTLTGNRFARVAALFTAFTLVAFIAGQLIFLTSTSGLQLVCLFVALAIAALSAFSAAR